MVTEAEKQKQPTYSRLLIFMERSYSEFNEEQRRTFLEDLSFISGASVNEIKEVSFRKGCVEFRGRVPKEAVDRIVEYFRRTSSDEESDEGESDDLEIPDELKDFLEFLEDHGIVFINEIKDSTGRTIRDDVVVTKLREPEIPSIVFVHGWSGDKDSFGLMPTYLSDLLGFKSYIYSYPTGAFSHSPSLIFISRNFENWIRNNIDSDRFAIVAHSMGGVVTKKMLVNQTIRDYPLDKKVGQVTLIASPHNGASLANIGKQIPFLRKAQLVELGANSPFMFDLEDFWKHWVSKHDPATCRVRSIFGTKDNVVSEINARGVDKNAIPILGADHISIVKPTSEKDEIVVTLARFMQEADLIAHEPHNEVRKRA